MTCRKNRSDLEPLRKRRLTRASYLIIWVPLLLATSAPVAFAQSQDLWDYSIEDLAAIRSSSLDHSLDQGQFLVGYQFMHMRMKGHQDGTSKISKNDFWNGTTYMVRPKWMTMDMHMFH